MAFHASQHTIQDNSLRYTYSGISFKDSVEGSRASFNHLERDRPRTSYYKTRDYNSYEYDEEFKTYLPKAPAFRCFSRHDVSIIVKRLSCRKDDTHNLSTKDNISTKSDIRKLTWEECDKLSARLNQPTQISKLRNLLRTNTGTQLSELALSCERCNVPPSKRYFPQCYKENI